MKDPEIGGRSERVALYGGAFDPVHVAHLRMAQYAIDLAGMDRVVFIPAAQSPLKPYGPQVDDDSRLRMLQLALGDETRFELSAYELAKGGISYTIDTARHFRATFPEAELYWIIGGDQFEQLDRWYHVEELASLVRFLVLARPGADLASAPEITNLRYQVIEAPLMSQSSSEVRERCRGGLSLEGFVSASVEAFISERELYTILQ